MFVRGWVPLSLPFAVALASASCVTWGGPRPLEPGEHAVSATVGGVLAEVPNVGSIPMPNLTVEGRHGIVHHLELDYGVHALPLLFGVAGAHVGAGLQLFDQPTPLVPALTVRQRLFGFTNLVDARKAAPAFFGLSETSLLASWELMDQLGWLGLLAHASLDEPHVHLSPSAGVELRPGLGGLRLGVEARWLAPAINQRYAVVHWLAPGDQGGIQLTAGVAWVFGGAS